MTRRSSTSPGTTRGRRAASPTRRAASGQPFARLGFAFFRLVSIHDRDPDDPPYAVLRLLGARTSMAAFVSARR